MTESNIETTNQAPKSIRIFSDICIFENTSMLLFCQKWGVSIVHLRALEVAVLPRKSQPEK